MPLPAAYITLLLVNDELVPRKPTAGEGDNAQELYSTATLLKLIVLQEFLKNILPAKNFIPEMFQ